MNRSHPAADNAAINVSSAKQDWSKQVDLCVLTVAQIQQGFASGTYSSEDLTRAHLERIEKYNPHYNAVITMNPEALADAREIDARRAAGEPLGPLAGVPVLIKDPMDMRGLPTTGGWSKLTSKCGGVDLIPTEDAPVVARMRAAGTIMLGKTNVPVLSYSTTNANNSWAGPTLNAVLEDRAPGASSAGTATAVATGMAVLGLAEETAGSIQNPASAQGLVAIKPTLGLVPNSGVIPLSGNRDVVGPIARCVHDAALCLDVLAGYSAEDPKTIAGVGRRPRGGYTSRLAADALKGKRIGLYGAGWRKQSLSAETAALYARVQDELRERHAILVADPFAGSNFADLAEVTPGSIIDARGLDSLPYDLDCYFSRFGSNASLTNLAEFLEATENIFAPGGRLEFVNHLPQFSTSLSNPSCPPDVSDFIALKELYLSKFEEVFDKQDLDAMIFPQMRGEVPTLYDGSPIQETTVSEINIPGLPGVVVPAGHYKSGAPFCLIIVGQMFSEADLLAYAFDYEQATCHRRQQGG